MPESPASRLVQSFDLARAITLEEESRVLSPKEFLDIVSPGNRNKKSARDYIRRLRSGERRGTNLVRRAEADSGRTVRAEYDIGDGEIRSQNLLIPVGSSRLDLYEMGLRDAVNKGLAESFVERDKDDPASVIEKYRPLKKLPIDARLVGVKSVSRAIRPAQVLRIQKP